MKVLDLDKFIPEEKQIKLGGKCFDITFIPFEITLQVYELLPVLQKIEKSESISNDDFHRIVNVLHQILQLSDDSIEKKWVVRQLTISRFNELIPFIFNALFDDGKKKEEANAEA